jgi:hypothetical protein
LQNKSHGTEVQSRDINNATFIYRAALSLGMVLYQFPVLAISTSKSEAHHEDKNGEWR